MPLFYFKCVPCDLQFHKLLEPAKGKEPHPCPECGESSPRAPKAPSTMAMETIDNGLMVRKVIRPSDAERIFKERSLIDPRETSERGDFKPVDKKPK